MQENRSEVARIRQQIDQEMAAMHLAMTGFSMTAQHQMINNRFAAIDRYYDELKEHIGEQQAIQVVIDSLDSAGQP